MIADGEVVNEHVTRALSVLNYDQLAEVQRHIAPTAFPPGGAIVRQGDPGDRFYILTAGHAEVTVEQPDGHELLVDHLSAGQYFGEMALICGAPRQATVRASLDGPVEAVALDTDSFNRLMDDSPALREELGRIVTLREVQTRVDALRDVNHDELRQLAAGAPTRVFAPGDTILRQGALGDSFFILLDGEVDVFANHGEGREVVIDHLESGSYFGEMALLGNRRRTATVRAAGYGPVRALELDAEAFDRLTKLSGRFEADVRESVAERQTRV